MKAIKLGVTYSVFSGEELLRDSILSIRDNVDYINIVYQTISWTGNKCNSNLENTLNELKAEGLVDSVIKFDVNLSGEKGLKWAQVQTCKKRNAGVIDLINNNCTHCMLMDADEFYRKEEFKKAKEFVIQHNISHSCCNIYDYKLSPKYRKIEANNYAVPFILKLNRFSRVTGHSNLPCVVDSLRIFLFLPMIHKFYYLNIVSMHHMTGVRKNIDSKLLNTLNSYDDKSTDRIKEYRRRFQEYQESPTSILEDGYIEVKGEFGLNKW